jgi:hypothetical protein
MAVVREHFEGTYDSTYKYFSGSTRYCQTFTPDVAHNIGKVLLYAFASYGTTGTATISIKNADANHKPTGSALASATVDLATFPSSGDAYSWPDEQYGVMAILSNIYALEASTEYVIEVSSTHGIYWGTKTTGYAGGVPVKSTNDGSSWTVETGYDLMFKEYEVGPPAAPASITYPSTNAYGEQDVSWDASEGALSYTLERSADDGENWTEVSAGGIATIYNESLRATESGNYQYRVKAINEDGESAWVTGGTCVVDIPPFIPPTTSDYAIKLSTFSGGVP